MTVIQGYIQFVLLPQLRSLALTKRQRAIVVEDVSRRLESLLFHWSDLEFRRTILILGTEEASFWEPQTASLEIRSLVVVAIRNSLIEDLGAFHPYTKVLESRKKQLRDEQMPSITSEATSYFEAANLDLVRFSRKGICLAIYLVDFRMHGMRCHFLAGHPRMRLPANCRSWKPNRWRLRLQSGRFSTTMSLRVESIRGWTIS